MRADNPHVTNALIEMFGNEALSEAKITKLEYRCNMRPFVDVGAIVGSSTGGTVFIIILMIVAAVLIKRKIRDEARAVMLLGKSEEEKRTEKTQLLDDNWRFRMLGIDVSLDTPLHWMLLNLSYCDSFLHVVVSKR